MSTYVPPADVDIQHVARSVLAHAGERAGEVQFHPLANTPYGGFTAPDGVLDGFTYKAPGKASASRSAKTQEG